MDTYSAGSSQSNNSKRLEDLVSKARTAIYGNTRQNPEGLTQSNVGRARNTIVGSPFSNISSPLLPTSPRGVPQTPSQKFGGNTPFGMNTQDRQLSNISLEDARRSGQDLSHYDAYVAQQNRRLPYGAEDFSIDQQMRNMDTQAESRDFLAARNSMGGLYPPQMQLASRERMAQSYGDSPMQHPRFGGFGGGRGADMMNDVVPTEMNSYLPDMTSLGSFAEQRGGDVIPRYREGPYPATQTGSNIQYTENGTPYSTMGSRRNGMSTTTVSRTAAGGASAFGNASQSDNTMGWDGQQRSPEQQKRFDFIRANRGPRSTASSRIMARQQRAGDLLASRRYAKTGQREYGQVPTQALMTNENGDPVPAMNPETGQPIMMPLPPDLTARLYAGNQSPAAQYDSMMKKLDLGAVPRLPNRNPLNNVTRSDFRNMGRLGIY